MSPAWRRAVPPLAALVISCLGCDPPDPDLLPDDGLRSELGLTDADHVHTVAISTGVGEVAEPDSISVEVGELVEFVSCDWLVHEMAFELDSLGAEARTFLERTGQAASPPLVQRDARFVLSFADAPPGRYPFVLAGNRESGRGVIVVARPPGFP